MTVALSSCPEVRLVTLSAGNSPKKSGAVKN